MLWLLWALNFVMWVLYIIAARNLLLVSEWVVENSEIQLKILENEKMIIEAYKQLEKDHNHLVKRVHNIEKALSNKPEIL